MTRKGAISPSVIGTGSGYDMIGKQNGSRNGRWWMAILLFAGLLLVACDVDENSATASEAAYAIDPVFESFYQQHGQTRVFGEPYTGMITLNGEDGLRVQYFQRMRLEYHADAPAGERVRVSDLGRWAYETAPRPETPVEEPPLVRDAFDRFYQTNGNSDLFGDPISPLMIEDDRWVKYYENARLEWYPARPQGLQVQLGVLGQSHYLAEAAFAHREQLSNIPRSAAGLRAVDLQGDVSAPILYAGEEQELLVYVSQITGGPVADVEVDGVMIVDGRQYAVNLGRSDGEGLVRQVLEMPEVVPGQWVSIQISARSEQGIIGTTTVRFQTWW